ncbi:hypothetical protein PHYBLDRAFT_70819 [Phycomyces blakesleeanus NRRL 1555(-)]|uniref:Uncharacterized protein n=1 Tax=Phycomyces blakesleeanus (strain ATCC 8743b / DSM 1359 / FGSC 10004 / NBRC 33097 / NRRL 1555) TaxID=763407 RepID=A0A162ZF00_PHYB8|nr:hypothetical protein PHYBLDRAFT_70819 [Phycomyces blakesleeanus NRRL 1555(-)]OAD66351.1 hypothetical protein PHYBLDRAFT_70819 [Phycomyces blakesleeanus NRRL 1555(-)]|eukprot:XP_018284391.1 hypothetical protein PHYBLDRAFT_70819 [Phycomyces blakesleeanus NRRL 1555(-)]
MLSICTCENFFFDSFSQQTLKKCPVIMPVITKTRSTSNYRCNQCPKEAKIDQMNNFLEPLVDELVELYDSITMKTPEFPNGTSICTALMFVACNIPAARKTAGFTGFASTNACHMCKHHFTVVAGTTVLEKQHGTRFSKLHRLHYFDPIRYTIVDPMHNLFLGTAKHMISVWKDLRYLPTAVLIHMQRLANGILVPPGYAVLSTKIESGFSYMKADKWQSWCLIYSLVVLKDALPEDDYRNWTLFVKACQKLTGPSVTYSEIDSAHQLLGKFEKECETLYGESSITPNIHLHMHLRESMLNFGPVYAFWLYSFDEALPPTTLPIKLQPLTMMKDDHYQWLFEFYVKAYRSTSVSFCVVGRIPIGENVFVNNRVQKVKKISLLGQEYCSGEKKKRGSFVRILFLERTNDNVSEFPGQIEYLFTHTIKIGGVKRVSTFAFIKWFPAYHSSSHQPLADQGLQL